MKVANELKHKLFELGQYAPISDERENNKVLNENDQTVNENTIKNDSGEIA